MIAVSSAFGGPPLAAAGITAAYMLRWLVRYSKNGRRKGVGNE